MDALRAEKWDLIAELLPGFDIERVQVLFGDNPDVYLRLLDRFQKDYSEEHVYIIFTLGIDEKASAEKMLHKLKGVSGNLGAIALNEACERLDEQLKKGYYAAAEYDEWMAVFQRTTSTVAALLRRLPPALANDVPGRNPAKACALAGLAQILASEEYVGDELLAALKSTLDESDEALYRELVAHVRRLDYPKARSTLKTLSYTV